MRNVPLCVFLGSAVPFRVIVSELHAVVTAIDGGLWRHDVAPGAPLVGDALREEGTEQLFALCQCGGGDVRQMTHVERHVDRAGAAQGRLPA